MSTTQMAPATEGAAPTTVHGVAVIGAGLMGHGIAQDFAAGCYEVHLHARSQERLDEALGNIHSDLALLKRLGQLNTEQAESALSRIRTGTKLEEMAADADLVIEAVSEDLAVKQQVFRALDDASRWTTWVPTLPGQKSSAEKP